MARWRMFAPKVNENQNKKATCFLSILKPTGHVMYQQFTVQQLYAMSTLYLCVLYLSENKQPLLPHTP